ANREFVQGARLAGASPGRIIRRELMPNVLPPMIAYAVVLLATLVTAEAGLSYLGLGVIPPTPSWGQMIADGQFQLADYPHVVFVPATVLALTIFGISVLGDWARAKFDIRQARI
ncbi:MAG: ABC transporter permease, partial [Actinobacteria bacterium]|nr:ABC transporter permease [Actinomycetota bacterium]